MARREKRHYFAIILGLKKTLFRKFVNYHSLTMNSGNSIYLVSVLIKYIYIYHRLGCIIVLVSWANYSELVVSAAHIYSFMVLEDRSLKVVSLGQSQGVGRDTPKGGSRGQSLPCLFQIWWLPAFLGLWLNHPNIRGWDFQFTLLCLLILCVYSQCPSVSFL